MGVAPPKWDLTISVEKFNVGSTIWCLDEFHVIGQLCGRWSKLNNFDLKIAIFVRSLNSNECYKEKNIKEEYVKSGGPKLFIVFGKTWYLKWL